MDILTYAKVMEVLENVEGLRRKVVPYSESVTPQKIVRMLNNGKVDNLPLGAWGNKANTFFNSNMGATGMPDIAFKLSDTKAMYIWTNHSSIRLRFVDFNGNTDSVALAGDEIQLAPRQLSSGSSNYIQQLSVIQLSPTSFVATWAEAYYNGTYTYACYAMAFTVDPANNTVTVGTVLTTKTSSATQWTLASCENGTNRFIIAYNGITQNYTLTGNTIAAVGSLTTTHTSTASAYLRKVAPDRFVAFFDNSADNNYHYAIAFTTTGNVITAGAALRLNGSYSVPGRIATHNYAQDKFLVVCRWNTNRNMAFVVSVVGTVVTLTCPYVEINNPTINNGVLYILSNQRAIYVGQGAQYPYIIGFTWTDTSITNIVKYTGAYNAELFVCSGKIEGEDAILVLSKKTKAGVFRASYDGTTLSIGATGILKDNETTVTGNICTIAGISVGSNRVLFSLMVNSVEMYLSLCLADEYKEISSDKVFGLLEPNNTVRLKGVWKGFTGLTAGIDYYYNKYGVITNSSAAIDGVNAVLLGVAISDTEILVKDFLF